MLVFVIKYYSKFQFVFEFINKIYANLRPHFCEVFGFSEKIAVKKRITAYGMLISLTDNRDI